MTNFFLVTKDNYETEGVKYLFEKNNTKLLELKTECVNDDSVIIFPVSSFPIFWGGEAS